MRLRWAAPTQEAVRTFVRGQASPEAATARWSDTRDTIWIAARRAGIVMTQPHAPPLDVVDLPTGGTCAICYVSTDFQEFHLVAFFNVYAHFFHCFVHVHVEDLTSVLRWKNQVAYEYRNTMTSIYLCAHLRILYHNGRGIQPEVIH